MAELIHAHEDAGDLWHLADGVILCVHRDTSQLVDLRHDVSVSIDLSESQLAPVEQLALGVHPDALPPALRDSLLHHALIEHGPAQVDAVVRAALHRNDHRVGAHRGRHESCREFLAYAALLDAHASRKRFYGSVGQLPTLPETALRRALLVGDSQEVGRLRVACVGDDDLVSVALAALGHDVTVFDVDDYLLTLLRRAARRADLDMALVSYDLRDPLAPAWVDGFDVFLTDPMPNRDCFELFLSRGLAMLRVHGTGYVAVAPGAARVFEAVAGEMHLLVQTRYQQFNRYYGFDLQAHEYESDWWRVARQPDSAPRHTPEAYAAGGQLYRDPTFPRRRLLQLSLDAIDALESVTFTLPLYMHTLLDLLETNHIIDLPERELCTTDSWSVMYCPTPEGFVCVRTDRVARQVSVTVYPYETRLCDALRDLMIAAYKPDARQVNVAVTAFGWQMWIA